MANAPVVAAGAVLLLVAALLRPLAGASTTRAQGALSVYERSSAQIWTHRYSFGAI